MRLTPLKSELQRLGIFQSLVDGIFLFSALFQLTAFTEDEKTRHLFKGDTVSDCITSANGWVTNRDGIWNALNSLETAKELTVCEPTPTPGCF